MTDHWWGTGGVCHVVSSPLRLRKFPISPWSSSSPAGVPELRPEEAECVFLQLCVCQSETCFNPAANPWFRWYCCVSPSRVPPLWWHDCLPVCKFQAEHIRDYIKQVVSHYSIRANRYGSLQPGDVVISTVLATKTERETRTCYQINRFNQFLHSLRRCDWEYREGGGETGFPREIKIHSTSAVL